MKKVYLVVVSIFCIQTIFAQQDSLCREEKNLKILSWNIYMLPRFIKNSGKVQRAQAIGDQLALSKYDVLVFQEAFHGGARHRIAKRLEKTFPYVAGPANKRFFSLKTNSGIWIFSKYPITCTKSIVFKNRCGIDAFSRKGALIVELNVEGKRIQIAGTHLQSSGDVKVRQSQCKELTDRILVPFEKSGIPQVVCGDFNIDRYSDESYSKMIATLNVVDHALSGQVQYSYDRKENDLHVERGETKNLIDYIFLRKNTAKLNLVSKSIALFQYRWDKLHQDLSDHYPLEAEIIFNNSSDLSNLF